MNAVGHFLASTVLISGMAGLACAPVNADPYTGWPTFGGAPGGGHYSALKQINRNNVAWLQQAWLYRSGDADRHERNGSGASYEPTPIFRNDLLYTCSTYNEIIALHPGTGRKIWRFNPHAALVQDAARASTCRGVAYWQSADIPDDASCEKRIFKGDRAGRMFAVDADTGTPCNDFGTGGFVDLTQPQSGGTGRLFMTSPPAVIGDALIIGGAVGDNIAADSPDGVIRALDIRTGKLLWRLVTIPAHLSKSTGGADVWPPFSVDADSGMIFIATGSPSVDVYGAGRADDIPYANAILAIEAATGVVRWHRQLVHHDLFDYDLPDQPHVMEIVRDGVRVPAVIQITKAGLVFVFHRDTGEPLFPIEERPVPTSDVPGEKSSPTQPFPVLPAPFSRQAFTRDQVFGQTFWDRNRCLDEFDTLRYEGPFTPPSERGSLIYPAPSGGGNWGGAAIDPIRSILVVKNQNFAFKARLVSTGDEEEIPPAKAGALSRNMLGTPYRIVGELWLSPWGVPCTPPPWGELSAIDLDNGEYIWRRPIGQVPFGPFGLLKSRQLWGSPVVGGPTITAGGLIFMAATTDARFRALDLDTGAELWATDLPAPGMAVPMTYEYDGRQFVLIAAGGSVLVGTELGDSLVAFALPTQ
jgi:quinoprotein glucose dehydrogenase